MPVEPLRVAVGDDPLRDKSVALEERRGLVRGVDADTIDLRVCPQYLQPVLELEAAKALAVARRIDHAPRQPRGLPGRLDFDASRSRYRPFAIDQNKIRFRTVVEKGGELFAFVRREPFRRVGVEDRQTGLTIAGHVIAEGVAHGFPLPA